MRSPRRYNVAVAVGGGLLGTAGLGWSVGAWVQTSAVYPLIAGLLFALGMAAILGIAGAEHPYARFGPANYITTTRGVLVALVAGLIGQPTHPNCLWLATGLTVLIVALDGLDGWVARRTGMTSAFGARFDMETDAALILVLSVLAWYHEKAGAWVLLCGLMRYGFVAAGWLLPWLAQPLRSTRRGKTVAVGQFLGLAVALAPIVHLPLSAAVAGAALATLTWSFAIDVRWLWHQRRTP